ncbi:MAG: hypothetical protein GXP29_09395 [Planctomycetes bacterium]|nr:hypothetical protein [Planctomycetota bacterium]
MIANDRREGALRAIQFGIAQARLLAYERESHKRIASFLDELDYLIAMLLEESEQTAMFEEVAREIGREFNCMRIVELFLGTTS